MKVTEEGKILNELIEVNSEACSFYHEAADKIAIPQAERALHDLERIHTSIVEGLGIAAYRNGDAIILRDTPAVFGRLRTSMPIPVDYRLVHAVENAENRCIEILEKAIDSDEVSVDIKMHVLEAVTMLQDRHEYIHRLRDVAASSGRAA